MNRVLLAVIVALVALFAINGSVFTVDQRQNAIVFQFGAVSQVITKPGLYFKLPPPFQTVRYFDTRIVTLDTPEADRFLTSEKKNVLVDSFVKWRIVDVVQYYQTIIASGGDEAKAHNRLSQTISATLREEFGKRTIHEVVSGERDKIMEDMRGRADADARTFGVQVIDVRLRRVDLPAEVSESVYRRMESERKRVANELRSTGGAEAEKIKADADRQVQVIVAEAYRDAQRVKGEGDAKATAIYAQAFGQNPEFYSFYRSLEAYRQSFHSKNDLMVVEPNSEFFKYFKNSGKAGK